MDRCMLYHTPQRLITEDRGSIKFTYMLLKRRESKYRIINISNLATPLIHSSTQQASPTPKVRHEAADLGISSHSSPSSSISPFSSTSHSSPFSAGTTTISGRLLPATDNLGVPGSISAKTGFPSLSFFPLSVTWANNPDISALPRTSAPASIGGLVVVGM